jgi:iron(III) transport system ATP-binding protein
MTTLKIKNLSHHYIKGKPVLNNIDIDLEEGEILSILGPSGCGKTTLLRIIAGLETQTGGTVNISDTVVSDSKSFVPTEKRDVGLVVQERALFPHMSIIKNVMFGLKGQRDEKYKTALTLLKLFKVDRYADNYPHEISSGEQQRVAMARAMAPNPKILLMDEPFGTLDHSLTHQLRIETKKVLKDNKITAIIVSHDFDDAISMSDRVIVIEEGIIKQQGTAKDITNIAREKQ